jgi:uncharacterized membrane protein YdcZ (DUF606 family)
VNHFYLLLVFVTGAGVAVQSVINARLRLLLGGVALLLLGVNLIRWKTS